MTSQIKAIPSLLQHMFGQRMTKWIILLIILLPLFSLWSGRGCELCCTSGSVPVLRPNAFLDAKPVQRQILLTLGVAYLCCGRWTTEPPTRRPSLDAKNEGNLKLGINFQNEMKQTSTGVNQFSSYPEGGERFPEGLTPSPFPPEFDFVEEPGLEHEDIWKMRSACDCWNTTEDGHSQEVECRCGGSHLLNIPSTLDRDIHRLTVVHAGIDVLRCGWLQVYKRTMQEVVFNNMRTLTSIEGKFFIGLEHLYTIYIDHAPLLRFLPEDIFDYPLPSLRTLRIVNTGLIHVPNLHHLKTNSILHMVDLDNNKIRKIPTGALRIKTEQLMLNYNGIEQVQKYAFNGSQIAKLSLKGNRQLKDLHPLAFAGLRSLRDIDLSETAITKLPTRGLKEIEVLRLQDTESLKTFPSIYNFEYLQVAKLTYPYHCCAFKFPATHAPEEYRSHQLFVEMIQEKFCATQDKASSSHQRRERREDATEDEEDEDTESFGRLVYSPDNRTYVRPGPDWGLLEGGFGQHAESSADGVFLKKVVKITPRLVRAYCGNMTRNLRDVECTPEPDAFSPCEDLLGNWALRTASWFVALAAMFGNLAVLIVMLSSHFRMTVPQFLMCNLALADLCMGIYMQIIATIDVISIGAYFNFAIDWQQGPGCHVAGFISVFACELSIYTLTVITSERWYAITHALHLDKRMHLNMAVRVMAFGWFYSLGMATLPLVGISSYSKTGLCLPVENKHVSDRVYLASLLMMNGLAFVLITGFYGRIYCNISGHNSVAARSDTTVAKRMALLVFTDFACWAPIAFFGLTAVAGFPLIDVSHSKILLVFFYPLNSCANPYLYALLTRQYRRDLFTLLSRYGLCARKASRYKQGMIAANNSVPPNGKTTSGSPKLSQADSQCNHVTSDGLSSSGREASSHRGSPHPLRNSNTRLHLSSEQEMILKRVLDVTGPTSEETPISDSHI